METEDADTSAADYVRRLPRNMVQNTTKILDHEDAVLKVDPDHFEVLSLRTPSRRVRVYRRADLWRCRVDKENNQDRPCSHILAVLIYEGVVDLPNTAATVWVKGKDGRNHAAEDKAWQLVPMRAPQLLRDLLLAGLPVVAPQAPPKRGRPERPVYAKVFQAVSRVLTRQSLRAAQGSMNGLDARALNPYGPVGRTTLSDYLALVASELVFEKLHLLTLWPVRQYETLVHPDGTGLTEQHFGAYFDEKYRRKKNRKDPDAPEGKKYEGPRLHNWTFAEILWTYRYTMIAALRTQQGPFGEAPWLIPLLERARIMLDIGELGGDKAYVASYIFDYAGRHGIDPQIRLKRNANPHYSHGRIKAYKRTVEEARLDPQGYAAKANRRNNAETGNRAFKAILGDQVCGKTAVAQRNEILCMASYDGSGSLDAPFWPPMNARPTLQPVIRAFKRTRMMRSHRRPTDSLHSSLRGGPEGSRITCTGARSLGSVRSAALQDSVDDFQKFMRTSTRALSGSATLGNAGRDEVDVASLGAVASMGPTGFDEGGLEDDVGVALLHAPVVACLAGLVDRWDQAGVAACLLDVGKTVDGAQLGDDCHRV